MESLKTAGRQPSAQESIVRADVGAGTAARFIGAPAIWFAAVAVVCFGFWVWTVLPVLHLPFVSDDYAVIVEDGNLPWYASLDRGYRLFRNGLLRLMPALFGLNPAPYHEVALAAYLVCLIFLFLFIRKRRVGVIGALLAVISILLYPRNAGLLFAFIFSQEVFMSCGILLALIGWAAFREQKAKLGYLSALGGFAFALGFKETAIVVPALLLVLDLLAIQRPSLSVLDRRFWAPYVGLFGIVVLFGMYVVLQHNGALLAPDSNSTYKYSSIAGTALAVAREIMNLSFPLSGMVALRDMSATHYAIAVMEWIVIGAAAVWTRTIRHWLFAVCWTLLAVLPPSMFNRPLNSARYMFVPMLGIVFALGASADTAVRRHRWLAPVLALAILLYAAAGTKQLVEQRKEWAVAGGLADQVVRLAHTLAPPDKTGALTFVNVPHHYKRAPVLNNGLFGALIASGYSRDVNFESNPLNDLDEAQRAFARSVMSCPVDSSYEPQHKILLWYGDTLLDRSGRCAEAAIARDQESRFYVWSKRYSNEGVKPLRGPALVKP